MEKKYEEFSNYNWNDSQEWKTYFNNLSEIPRTTHLVMHFRKRFYKLKIDPDFDDKYMPKTEINNSNNTYTHPENSKNENLSDKKSIFDLLITSIECCLWVAYFFNILLQNYNLIVICLIPLSIELFKDYRSSKDNKEYFSNLSYNEYFHIFIYVELLYVGKINYFFLFPITLTAFYFINFYFSNYLRILTFLKNYFDKITSQKDNIDSIRGFTFILLGFYTLLGYLLGWIGIFFTVLYFIFLRFLYTHNYNVMNNFIKISRIIEYVMISNKAPAFVKFILNFLKNFIAKIGGEPNMNKLIKK